MKIELNIKQNPDKFEKDYSFYKKKTSEFLREYIAKRYQRNKEKIELFANDITRNFIVQESNINGLPVTYPSFEDFDWLERRATALSKLEHYVNLNAQALLWTYKDGDKWKFEAVHARDFSILSKDSVVIRNGTRQVQIEQETETQFVFNLWKNGQEYECAAKTWSDVMNGECEWAQLETYDIFPFTYFDKASEVPVASALPTFELAVAGGFGWGDISAQVAFLVQIFGHLDMKSSEWIQLAKDVGLSKMVKTNKDAAIEGVQMGTAEQQEKWIKFLKEAIRFLAVARGVSTSGWLSPILAGLSGLSRVQELGPLKTVRAAKIPEWRDFEERHQELLVKLGLITKESKVVYSELQAESTDEMKNKNEKSRMDNIIFRYNNGTITNIQKIMEMENLNEEEAKTRNSKIEESQGRGSDE